MGLGFGVRLKQSRETPKPRIEQDVWLGPGPGQVLRRTQGCRLNGYRRRAGRLGAVEKYAF